MYPIVHKALNKKCLVNCTINIDGNNWNGRSFDLKMYRILSNCIFLAEIKCVFVFNTSSLHQFHLKGGFLFTITKNIDFITNKS